MRAFLAAEAWRWPIFGAKHELLLAAFVGWGTCRTGNVPTISPRAGWYRLELPEIGSGRYSASLRSTATNSPPGPAAKMADPAFRRATGSADLPSQQFNCFEKRIQS